jgi:hypothetical protein
MSEKSTNLVIKLLGVCAIVLVTAIAWGAVKGSAIDVSCSTLAGSALGALGALLAQGGGKHPDEKNDPK